MTTLRWRKLYSSLDVEDLTRSLKGRAFDEAGRLRTLSMDESAADSKEAFNAIVGGVRRVDVREGSATVAELRQLIAAEQLSASDLVSTDGESWTTLENHPELYDLFEPRRGPGVAVVLAIVAAAVALLGVLVWFD